MNLTLKKDKFFRDKNFYKGVLVPTIPIIIQQLITSFVNMLGNIMVGQTGTFTMNGVSVASQLITVFDLTIFSLVSAANISAAQFVGKKDYKNVQNCLYLDVILSFTASTTGVLIFWVFGEKLLYLFMNPNTNTAKNIATIIESALDYTKIMTIGFIPFTFSQSVSSLMRVSGEARLPMITSMIAVLINFMFNLVLIFGLLSFPTLGPRGAAVATVISRFIELSLLIYFANKNKFRLTFYSDFFKNFHAGTHFFKDITVAGIPLIINKVLYSLGIAAITQSYSTRGIEALAACNISQTIIRLFIAFNLAMEDCISIMVGGLLGSGNVDEAVDTDKELTVFSFMLAVVVGIVLIILALLFPEFYNTTDGVKLMAMNMLKAGGAFLRISTLYNTSYLTLRSSGKTVLTLLLDSVGIVLISYPLSFLLAKFTDLNVVLMYLIVSVIDLYKVILGLALVGEKIWVRNSTK